MTSKLISFDPGVSLGYAVWEPEKYRSSDIAAALLQHGCSKGKAKETEKARLKRHLNLLEHLRDLHGHHELTVVTESQFFWPGMPAYLQKSIAVCQEIQGLIKTTFVDYTIKAVSPKDWQGALLSGMGSKIMVDGKPEKYTTKDKSLYRCGQLLGKTVRNHNETDAILIGVYFLDHLGWAEKLREAV